MSAPPTSFTAACVQMRSSCDVAENIAAAKTLVREAASKGADLVMTPEMTSLLVTRTSDLFDKAREEKDDEALEDLELDEEEEAARREARAV